MLLPNVSNLPIPESRQFRFGSSYHIFMLVVYRPRGGFIKTANQVKQRTLSRAAFADNRNLLSLGDVEREIAEDDKILVARAVDLCEIFDADQRRGQR